MLSEPKLIRKKISQLIFRGSNTWGGTETKSPQIRQFGTPFDSEFQERIQRVLELLGSSSVKYHPSAMTFLGPAPGVVKADDPLSGNAR